MRLLDYLTGLVALVALPFIAWWGVNQSPQSAVRLEARLEAQANQSLQLAGITWARAEMDGQTAILSGAAPSEDAIPEAAGVLLRSSGAGGLLFGGVSQVETRVEAAPPVWPYVWSAERTPGGGFVLSGHAPSAAVRSALLLEAQALATGDVVDRMILAPGAPDGNWQGVARFAITQLAELDEGRATLAGHVLTLRGAAPDDTQRARLAHSVRAVAAPFKGVSLIKGVPAWSATLVAGGVVLGGQVPSEADRRAVLSLARSRFPGGVTDQMTVAQTGATGWTKAAEAGLARLVAFESGSLAFDPVTGGFMVEGAAAASTLQLLMQDMVAAAGAWRVEMGAFAQPPAETAMLTGSQTGPAVSCEQALNELIDSEAISFERGQVRFRNESAAALDQFGALARGCGTLQLAVQDDALLQARAALIADYLELAGARRPRIAAIGYGPGEGPQGMESRAALTSQRPLEFTERERGGQ